MTSMMVAASHLHEEQVCVVGDALVHAEGEEHGGRRGLAGIGELVLWVGPGGIDPLENLIDPPLVLCVGVPPASDGTPDHYHFDWVSCKTPLC